MRMRMHISQWTWTLAVSTSPCPLQQVACAQIDWAKVIDAGLSSLGAAAGIALLCALEKPVGIKLYAPPLAAAAIIIFAGPRPPPVRNLLLGTAGVQPRLLSPPARLLSHPACLLSHRVLTCSRGQLTLCARRGRPSGYRGSRPCSDRLQRRLAHRGLGHVYGLVQEL